MRVPCPRPGPPPGRGQPRDGLGVCRAQWLYGTFGTYIRLLPPLAIPETLLREDLEFLSEEVVTV